MLKTLQKMINNHARKVIHDNFDDITQDRILTDATQEFEALLPQIPYISGEQNSLTFNLVSFAWILAL